MLFGTFAVFLSLIGLTAGFYNYDSELASVGLQVFNFISFVVFICSFTMTVGPITWLYIPEIVQPPTIPYTTMTSWACAYLMVFLFPIIR